MGRLKLVFGLRELSTRIGKLVTVVGWPLTSKTVHDKDGRPMKFMTFEDLTGTCEVVFFPDVYHRFCNILNLQRPDVLRGKVAEHFSALSLTVNGVEILSRSNLRYPSAPPWAQDSIRVGR